MGKEFQNPVDKKNKHLFHLFPMIKAHRRQLNDEFNFHEWHRYITENITEICIGFHRSSSVLDALAVNIPCIKLWSWKAWDKKDFNEQRYLKRYGAHNSILTELKLTKLVSNENELKQIILSNKQFKNKLLKKQKKSFIKLNIYNKHMNKVLRKILK